MRLVERKPLRPLVENPVRRLLVTEEINDLLDGKRVQTGFPDTAAEKLIGVFSAGWLVAVSRKKTKARPDLEQIEGQDEVWALCIRKPVPGWRLLGRFYHKNLFVALRPWEKHKLFSQYNRACEEVIDDWQTIFGTQEPCRGTELTDYLSGVIRDVDSPI